MGQEVFILYSNFPGGAEIKGVVTDSAIAKRWTERASSNEWKRATVDDPNIYQLLGIPQLPVPE